MESFLEFFTESVEIDNLVDFLANRYLKYWDEFVKRGQGEWNTFAKLSAPLNRPHALYSLMDEITESGHPEKYAKILMKYVSDRWQKQLQKKVVEKAKQIIRDEATRKRYGMGYAYPNLSEKLYQPVLEYRHKDAFGGIKQSIHANNKKGGNITRDPLSRKIPWNVGPYKKIRKPGEILIGDDLIKELGTMGGVEFEDGKEIKRKNSNQILKLFTNAHGQQCGKIVEIKR